MTTIISGSSPSITFSDSTTQTTAANITAPYTSNGVVYASSTSALATGSALQFDGTNLGLGATPSAFTFPFTSGTLQMAGGFSMAPWSSNAQMYISTNAYYNSGWKYNASSKQAAQYNLGDGGHAWLTSASGTAGNAITFTQAMTLTSTNNLLIGTTTKTSASISDPVVQIAGSYFTSSSQAGYFWENRSTPATSNSNWYGWYTTSGTIYAWNGSANIASINASSGAYTALSDRNKKKDFEDSTLGLSAVLQLKPTLYRMLDADENSEKELGFIAQDVKDVIPQAYIEIQNDSTCATGNSSKFIGLNDRAIVATLTKAIQEQQKLIQSLTDRLNALESK